MTQDECDELKKKAGLPNTASEIRAFINWPSKRVVLFAATDGTLSRRSIFVRAITETMYQKVADLGSNENIPTVMCSELHPKVVFTTAINGRFKGLFVLSIKPFALRSVTFNKWDGSMVVDRRIWVQQIISLEPQGEFLIVLLGILSGKEANYSLVRLDTETGAITTIEKWPAAIF